MLPGLTRLARRFPLASLSNGNADLARIGLDHLFEVSLNARQIGVAKPHRRCFERLAAELALAPGAILYVGDDALLDVLAARSAGCASAWMNRGAQPWPAALAPADLDVARPAPSSPRRSAPELSARRAGSVRASRPPATA